ncbi:MAG: penicillin-binding protein 2 [Patescibacteria group bacterium]
MESSRSWRIYSLTIIIFILGSGVLARLFSLQIFEFSYYTALAQGQQQLYQTLFPERGEIFMQDLSASRRNGEGKRCPLAVNREFKQAYLIPQDIPAEKKDGLAEQLAQLLDLDKSLISERINKIDDPYEPLKHKLDEKIAQMIEQIDVEGLELAPETWRYYPHQALAGHLLGFVGTTEQGKVGQYGLEGYYEDELSGQVGFLAGEKDIAGYWIPSLNQQFEPAQNGSDLILTIDQNIQFKAEKELKEAIKKWGAAGGTIIVMEPSTGAIRAMVSEPCFDPNEYNKVEGTDIFLNPATQKVYEPGSVFKPITIAAGLDSGQISPETVYYDEGQVKIKGSVIRNVDGKAYQEQTMIQVLEKSLNTGAIFVQQKVGEDIFQDYVQRFNFNKPTGVDLASEIAGNITNLFTGREINLATISFGQGITVTPLGLITALGAIANQGKLMKPFIVEKIVQPDGTENTTRPQVVNQVISLETAGTLTKMLVSAVDNGFARKAGVVGYSVAGKTGTAQVANLGEIGYSDKTIHTFVGYAPAFNPQFIILIKLDEPQGVRFASDSITSVFQNMAKFLLNYLEIPPQ